jgi:hypothetical protein
MTEFEGCMVGIGFAFIFIAIFKNTSGIDRAEKYLMQEKNKELRRLVSEQEKAVKMTNFFSMEGSMPKPKKKKDTSVKIPKSLRVRKEK